jgi:succinate dehydrogenase hydrophobic anchor subunit
MIRLWAFFILFAVLIHLGIAAWRALSELEKLALTKSILYSLFVSLLALAVMSGIVILF